MPYALNEFAFESQLARREFEKSARPGKKQVVKKAIRAYSILPLSALEVSLRVFMAMGCEESEYEESEESEW